MCWGHLQIMTRCILVTLMFLLSLFFYSYNPPSCCCSNWKHSPLWKQTFPNRTFLYWHESKNVVQLTEHMWENKNNKWMEVVVWCLMTLLSTWHQAPPPSNWEYIAVKWIQGRHSEVTVTDTRPPQLSAASLSGGSSAAPSSHAPPGVIELAPPLARCWVELARRRLRRARRGFLTSHDCT